MKVNQLNLQGKNIAYGEILSNSDLTTMTRKIHYGYNNNNTSLLIDLIEVELLSQICSSVSQTNYLPLPWE